MIVLSDSFDRPAIETNEIEVTPEMIEAGMGVAYLMNEDLYDRKDSLAILFRAMASKMPRIALVLQAH